ncbi:hypothetical protein JCM6882_002333 [Rhodosporidiobolus microsporus]
MPPSNPSPYSGKLAQKSDKKLEVHYKINSVEGLSSITTLIVGAEACVLIDAPFLIPDAKEVIKFIKEKTSLPLVAVFVTHHHPDHFFSANPILEEWPESRFLAAPYVLEGIEREYDEKIVFWPSIYGDLVPKNPRKPEAYPYSFFILPGNSNSPIFTVGPCQGDSVAHSMFYLPRERTIITGDCMYSRSVHVWAAEIDTPEILSAWQNILDLIEGLDVDLIIPGHAESDEFLDKAADLEYNRKYLELFATKITYAEKKPQVEEIVDTFKSAFPECKHNHGFFLGKLGDCYGEGGPGWPENALHQIGEYTTGDLEGFVMSGEAGKLEKRMRK